MEGPVRASPEDFDSIVEVTEECFPRDKALGGMLPRWPHCFRKERVRNCLIFKDAGKVVSHVGCIDQTVMLGRREVRVAGISSVATLPPYRKRGLMTKLLQHAIRFMTREGYAFSDLGGDRLRYGRFGWETAGRVWRYNVTPRSFNSPDDSEVLKVSEYRGTQDELQATLALHQRQRVGLKRNAQLHGLFLSRLGKRTWIVRKEGRMDSYAVTSEDETRGQIVELGGTPTGIRSVFQHLFDAGLESVGVDLPWVHPLNSLLVDISSGWSVACLRQIKILDLQATIEAFSDQLLSRYRLLGLRGERKISLVLSPENRGVELRFSEGGLAVQPASGRHAVALPERKMVRLIFGPGSPGTMMDLPPEAAFLEALLPVDFFIWRNEMV